MTHVTFAYKIKQMLIDNLQKCKTNPKLVQATNRKLNYKLPFCRDLVSCRDIL